MNPPRWDTESTAIVRAELLHRVEDVRRSSASSAPDGRRRRIMRSVVAAAVVLAVVLPAAVFAVTRPPGGRLVSGAIEPPPSSAGSGSAVLEQAAGLIGLWKVQADGEDDTTWVRFSPGSVTVERNHLLVFGSWVAGGDRIVVAVTGWDGRLADTTVPWLEHAAAFRVDGAAMVLLDGERHLLATLRPATEAPLPRGAADEVMNGRTTAAEITAAFTAPMPPAQLGPAVTAAALAGRWRTGRADAEGGRPFLAFAADGTYRASDGCNGTSGRWLLSSGNRVAFTGALHTEVACENLLPVPAWTDAARTVSVRNGRLTLYDRDGAILGSFDRG